MMRETGGAIINVGSIAGDRAYPSPGHLLRQQARREAFTEALRMEIEADGTPVSVTLVKPASIGTPIVEHAKNYMEREPRLPSPALSARRGRASPSSMPQLIRSATSISAQRSHDRRRSQTRRLGSSIFVGDRVLFAAQKQEAGALGRIISTGAGEMAGVVRHDPEERWMHRSLYTRAVLHPGATGAAVAAAGLGLALVLGRSSERKAGQARH